MKSLFRLFRAVILPLLTFAICAQSTPIPPTGRVTTPPDRAWRSLHDNAVVFIENKGQIRDTEGRMRSDVLYVCDGDNVRVFFGRDRISYVFQQIDLKDDATADTESLPRKTRAFDVTTYRMDMELIGANPGVVVHPEDAAQSATTMYSPALAGGSALLQGYRKIVYQDVYPGIDLVFYGGEAGLKYDFIIRPGGDARLIKFRYPGSTDVRVGMDASLRVANPAGHLTEGAPVSSLSPASILAGSGVPVETNYRFDDGAVSFDVAPYDRSRTLTIDPTVLWGTYYGDLNHDHATDVTYDAAGNVIICGYSFSASLPNFTGTFQSGNNGDMDAFVAKFNSVGVFQWYTLYGGSESDPAFGIAVDGAGNIYFGGETYSGNFPVTGGAFQTALGGGFDAYLVKLNPAGARQWATFIGGGSDDHCYGLSVNLAGDIALTGRTNSSNFPVTPAAFQTSIAGAFDAFIMRFNTAGQRQWGTYFGGAISDAAFAATFDLLGNIVITGSTFSANLPFTTGAFQTVYRGYNDCFIAKFDGAGARLWATFLGGTGDDNSFAIAVDDSNAIVVTGSTTSNDFPVSLGAFFNSNNGGEDAFVAKFSPTGARQWATYYGGVLNDDAYGISADRHGNIAFGGITFSPNFPVSPGAIQTLKPGAADGFLVKLNRAGNRIWATYFGGTYGESVEAVKSQVSGNVLIAGWSNSTNLPIVNAAFPFNRGGYDAFVAKICDVKPVITPNGATNLCAGGSVMLDAGSGYLAYTWFKDGVIFAGTQTITATAPGKYVVRVDDGLNCIGFSDTTMVNVGPPLVANAGGDQAVCYGSSTVIGTLATGGVPPLRYHWSPVTGLSDSTIARPVASPTSTKTYTVTVTDAYNCTSTSSMTLAVLPRPSVNAGADAIICYGTSKVIGNTATGGTPTYRYSWSPVTGLNDASLAQPTAAPLVTTTYIVSVLDANSCEAKDTVVVTVDRVTVDAGKDRYVCFGDSVQIGNTAFGGRGTYTYSWTPSTGLSATNVARPKASPPLGSTTLQVTATDSLGCSATDFVTVYVTNTLTASAGPDHEICLGAGGVSLGDTAVCGTPPYTYSWTPTTNLINPNQLHPVATPLSTTTYTLTVTDAASNTATDNVTVVVNPKPTVSAGPDLYLCKGSSAIIGEFATGGTPGYTYSWTPATGLSSTTVARPTASPSVTTTYTVTATDYKGCQANGSATIVVSDLAVSAGPDFAICLGTSGQMGTVVTGGLPKFNGFIYRWNPSTGLSSDTDPRPFASPRVTTQYDVTVTDSMGCVRRDTVLITVNPVPVIDAGRDTTICRFETARLGTLASGGLPPYQYVWSPPAGLNSTTIAQPLGNPIVTTKYFLTVTDSRGCQSRDSVLVTVRPYPTATAGKDTSICRYDSVRLGAPATGGTPPYIYSWKPRYGLSDTTIAQPYAKPFMSTTYNLTVTDANGCQDFATVTVQSVAPPLSRIKPLGSLIFCEGGSVTLDSDSSRIFNSYKWFKEGDTTLLSTSRQYVARETGLYKAWVKMSTLPGCWGESNAVQVISVPRPKPRVIESGPLTFCEGGSITFHVEYDTLQKYSFYWSTGDTTDHITVTASGGYSVTMTERNGCSGTSPTFMVEVFPKPAPSIEADGPTTFCMGDSVVLTAEAGFASYRWNTGSTKRSIVVKQSGSFSVTVTDANGCSGPSAVITVTMVPLPVPTITASGPLSFCEGGSVTLDAGAGYSSYHWSHGPTTRTVIVGSSGTFTVTVNNSNKCVGTSTAVSVNVKQNPRPVVTALGSTEFCQGDSVRLDAGEGYASYRWNTGSRQRFITVKTAGNFYVTVTNADGCTAISPSVNVTVHAKPTASITTIGSLSFCPGDSVILDAGAGFSFYTWSTGERTRQIIVKESGVFTVTVTNQYGCSTTSASVATTKSQSPKPTVTATGPLAFCEGGSVQLDGGAGWATYLWSTGAKTRRITVTQAGFYNVTVSNGAGCSGESDIIEVKVYANPPIPVITQNNNTLISTAAVGYQWNRNGTPIPGATQRTYAATSNGQYTVTVTNQNNCSSTSAVFDFRYVGIEQPASARLFTLYPDPNNGTVLFEAEFSRPVDAHVRLMNVLGSVVQEFTLEHAEHPRREIDMTSLPSGLYFLHVQADGETFVRKLIKQ
jgi:hypothetical protein